MTRVNHWDRFFNGALALLVTATFGVVIVMIVGTIGWWTFLIPIGVFMVICIAYGVGWGIDIVQESRHRRAHDNV